MIILGIDCGINNYAIAIAQKDESTSKEPFGIKIIYLKKFDFEGKEFITIYQQQLRQRLKNLVNLLKDLVNKYKVTDAAIEQQMPNATRNCEMMASSATCLLMMNVNVSIISPCEKFKVMELETNFTSYRNLKDASTSFIISKFPYLDIINKSQKKDDLADAVFIIIQMLQRTGK